MTPLSVGVRIWAKTLAMNAVFWGIGCVIGGEITAVLFSVVLLIGGFIVTLPLLMLIVPLVRVSAWLPYDIPAKTAWLTFWLALLIFLLHTWVSMNFDNALYREDPFLNLILASTLAGLLFAVLTTRKSLKKLYSK